MLQFFTAFTPYRTTIVLMRKDKSIIIIIIIIKKGRQCKAKREWYTSYQFEDPSPTTPTYRQKEEKGKKSRRKTIVGIEQLRPIKKHWPCSWKKPASPTPSNMGLARSFQRNTEKGIKVMLFCKVLQWGGAYFAIWTAVSCVLLILLRFYVIVCSRMTVRERYIYIHENPGCRSTSCGFYMLHSCNLSCALYSCRVRHCQQILPGKVAYCRSMLMHSIGFYMLGLPISSDAVFLRLAIIRNTTIFIIDKWILRTLLFELVARFVVIVVEQMIACKNLIETTFGNY